ncbi:unnamed protein product, partial [Calypogeia fissa]
MCCSACNQAQNPLDSQRIHRSRCVYFTAVTLLVTL